MGIPHGRSRRTRAYEQTYPIPGDMKKEQEVEITITLIVFERRLRPRSGQLNLCNEVEAKSIKFVLLATRYVNCLNYLCCFSRSTSMNDSQTLLLRFKNNI